VAQLDHAERTNRTSWRLRGQLQRHVRRFFMVSNSVPLSDCFGKEIARLQVYFFLNKQVDANDSVFVFKPYSLLRAIGSPSMFLDSFSGSAISLG
jgi:hypothetical protein